MTHEVDYQLPSIFIIFWIILMTWNIFRFVPNTKTITKKFVVFCGVILLSLVFIFGELKRGSIENEIDEGRLNILNGTISNYKPYNNLVDLYVDGIKIKSSFGSLYCGLPKSDYLIGDKLTIKYIKLTDHDLFGPEFCMLDIKHVKVTKRKRPRRSRYNNTLKNGRSETAPLS